MNMTELNTYRKHIEHGINNMQNKIINLMFNPAIVIFIVIMFACIKPLPKKDKKYYTEQGHRRYTE